MIEMTWIPEFIRGAVWIYLLLWLSATVYVLLRKCTTQKRVINTVFVTLAFGLLPGYLALSVKKYEDEQKPVVAQRNAQLEAAMARFEERCKTAGERITRTVENVDGVVLMKWRTRQLNQPQFNLDDPYGKDCMVAGCIVDLLRASEGLEKFPESAKRHSKGFQFVESIDPSDGRRYRYSGALMPIAENDKKKFNQHVEDTGYGGYADGSFFGLRRTQVGQFSARYGITWDDISSKEDRELWIAGGSLKVIDLQTNETIAERVGYLIDRGQGSTAGFRDPWGFAQISGDSCPKLVDENGASTRIGFTQRFVNKVIQPNIQGK